MAGKPFGKLSVPTSPRAVARFIGIGTTTAGWVALASLHQALVPPKKRDAVFQSYMKRWATSLVHATGGRITLTESSHIPPHTGPRIVVSNHRSPFDIGVLLSLFGGHALSREDIANWPVIGLAARRAGTIFVNRDSPGSGAQAIRAIRRKLAEGASILVFPEGGTFAGDEVRPFKPGAFAALRGLDVEILPVGLAYDVGAEWSSGGFADHMLNVAARPTTHCVVSIGRARKAEGRSTLLAESLQREVAARVDDARRCHSALSR